MLLRGKREHVVVVVVSMGSGCIASDRTMSFLWHVVSVTVIVVVGVTPCDR
jgi:nucleoside phosphorylase